MSGIKKTTTPKLVSFPPPVSSSSQAEAPAPSSSKVRPAALDTVGSTARQLSSASSQSAAAKQRVKSSSQRQIRQQSSLVEVTLRSATSILHQIGEFGKTSAVSGEARTTLIHEFLKARSDYDDARRRLMSGSGHPRTPAAKRQNKHVDDVLQRRGTAPQIVNSQELQPKQEAALWQFLTRFQNPEALGVSAYIAHGATSAHPNLLLALSHAVTSSQSSVDAAGAPNIDHLGSVFRGVLKDTSVHLGRPLDQAELNETLATTLLTDIWLKGRMPQELDGAQMAPMIHSEQGTSVGSTGKKYQAHLRAVAKESIRENANVSPEVLKLFDGWIDKDFIPMAPSQVEQAGINAGLNSNQIGELKNIWGSKIMGQGIWRITNNFMRGTLMHGLPSFGQVNDVAKNAGASGGSLISQKVYLCVLSHHICEFVMAGLALGKANPDFAEIEKQGNLPEGTGVIMQDLYKNAMTLALKWRPEIDKASAKNMGLSEENRALFRNEATALREAIQKLPLEAQRQLYFDDYMQFTPDGIEKWINLCNSPAAKSNSDILNQVYSKSAQGYFEASLARDLETPGSPPGKVFVDETMEVASRLGIHFDSDCRTFREATPGEDEHAALARNILANPELKTVANPALHSDPAKLVEWFRQSEKNPATLVALGRASQ